MKNVLKDKTAAIVFLARDCGKTLPAFLDKVEDLRKYYAASRVFAVENGSRDETAAILKDYAERVEGVTVNFFEYPGFDDLLRMERMVLLRNKCLDMLKESGFEPDHYVLIDGDLDFCVPSLNKAVAKAPADWGALFANGKYFLEAQIIRIPVMYYDLFAYLPENAGNDSLTEDEMIAMRPYTEAKIRKHAYTACRSAFGGVGIYRYSAVKDCRYAVEDNTVSGKFPHLCEHIPFNRGVKGKLYICRKMKVLYEPVKFVTWLELRATEKGKPELFRKAVRVYHFFVPRKKQQAQQ